MGHSTGDRGYTGPPAPPPLTGRVVTPTFGSRGLQRSGALGAVLGQGPDRATGTRTSQPRGLSEGERGSPRSF